MHSFFSMKSKIALVLSVVACLSLTACKESPNLNNYGKVTNVGSVDKVHGTQTKFSYGAFEGVGGVNANGVGYIRTYEDGVSIVTLNVNIAPAEKGKSFEVTLLMSEGSKKVELGELRSIVGDVRHTLTFETKQSLQGFDQVDVMLDETVVARGSLKEPPSE